ncbi:MAG: hypothetical protein Q7R80_03890 [bacterium]|nr:hypothetical protein [bacterium]
MQRTLTVSRHGDNIFIAGLSGHMGAVQIVPALNPDDLAVDRTLYVHVETRGSTGVYAELRRRGNHEVVRRASSNRSVTHLSVGGRHGEAR